MLKLFALFIGMAHSQAVGSPSYLIFPNQAACLTRSQQMCAAMGCDGVNTKFWWSCSTPLNAGTVGPTVVLAGSFAMRIEQSGPFGRTTSNSVSGVQGLTTAEQSNLVSAIALVPLIKPAAK